MSSESKGDAVTTRSAMGVGTLPAGWTARPAEIGDVDRAVEMMNARSQKFYGENQITREDVEAWWKSPRLDPKKDLQVVFDPRGDVAGIASVGNPGEPYAEIGCAGVTHPNYEGLGELWDWMHAWGLERARELVSLAAKDTRVAAVSNIAMKDAARRAALERAGFAMVRVANHMRIELSSPIPAASWPAAVSVRTVNVERDLRGIVALYLETWRDHWGFVEPPFEVALEDFREAVTNEGQRFDSTLWFLAVDGDEIVGISLCNSHIADDSTRGYVRALGVRPAWRQRGVALALLHHTFAEFRRREYAAVDLDMDSENLTGALRVYERAGMRAVRQSVFYEKELRVGTDLATRSLAS
jgi:mycothiol synthase